ncbi:calcium/sodium antiporter [Aquibaculum arenosum]|uniref:Calcium/sodium antiporter n=1 Tax=Aquibaculum arenosum TaxID=3032591 RepID=A0ABT5YLD7_9PROT|nr:calcium/sodium antiporter [Fodinicurvata sp. CAU 1616]MDF2095758.1 calcium/sodium antiporter [Fodinicurvata sp. CAU 1616]
MLEIWLPLLGGLILLIAGGELLVRGSVQVAAALGVSPLVIGLTLVGFGTSTPELVTSVQAALIAAPGIAYGNIVGSNIANILLIVGLASLLSPIAVASRALKRDALFMVLVALVFAGLAAVLPMGRVIGAGLVAALIAYVYLAFRQERMLATAGHTAVFDKSQALQGADSALTPPARAHGSLALSVVIALAGLALVVLGGTFLVEGAISLARGFAISEAVIGLTIVAVGTSMPELVTSVVAGLKRQGDVVFGNIVGSNIYNLLGIGGATALIARSRVPAEIVAFDNLVMVGVTLVLVLFAWSGRRIARWEGALLLAGYGLYIFVLWP